MSKHYEGKIYLVLNASIIDSPVPGFIEPWAGWDQTDDSDPPVTTRIHPTWRQLEGRVFGPMRQNIAGTRWIARVDRLPPAALYKPIATFIDTVPGIQWLSEHRTEVRAKMRKAEWSREQ